MDGDGRGIREAQKKVGCVHAASCSLPTTTKRRLTMPSRSPTAHFLGLELATDQLRAAVVDEQLELGPKGILVNSKKRIFVITRV